LPKNVFRTGVDSLDALGTMAGMKDAGYWLITVQVKHCSGYSTLAIDQHPAEYMTENLGSEYLVFAMPISKAQYEAFDKAYSG
jgi:hypothetical protein